jgi:hypothetical protein
MFGQISQFRIASYLKNNIPCLEDGNYELLRGLLDEKKIVYNCIFKDTTTCSY